MSSTHAEPERERTRLAALGIERIRAENPGPLTLSGTNTWVVGSTPAYVVDPGPSLQEHLARVAQAVRRRGGLGGVALTHQHADHREGVSWLVNELPAPVAAARAPADVLLSDGTQFGPLQALATPGHAVDHVAFLYGRACFTGDAVLGEGSVFISPDPGALRGYLGALARLQAHDLEVLCPGHGPPVWDPPAKLESYVSHRLQREHLLVQALAAGRRSTEELLDAAWSDVAPQLRPAAAITLTAHLDKLHEEGRLPDGVQRPH